jgi:hypothetical protein
LSCGQSSSPARTIFYTGRCEKLKKMEQLLVIAIIILGFWSVITTFKAIYLILTKEFKGDKLSWILFSLIAIIGPILWLTKGKKLISSARK